ncbi:MAG: ribosome maturation factor RimP [Tissierellia bacterium]|nr:ribosome maturation factor RimP [Tissierellia bacterium]
MNKKELYVYITNTITPLLEANHMELVELQIKKAKDGMHIIAYIYKDGGVTLDDCTDISRGLGERLDDDNLIEEAYYLEVSSPGLDRPLKTQDDYRRNLGKKVEVKLYKEENGARLYKGLLAEYDSDNIVLDVEGNKQTFEISSIALMKQYIEF